MALYRYDNNLHLAKEHVEFNKLYKPGDSTPWSGIYHCEGCGHEVVHTHDKPLAPQNHKQHTPAQGPIRYRLVVTDQPVA